MYLQSAFLLISRKLACTRGICCVQIFNTLGRQIANMEMIFFLSKLMKKSLFYLQKKKVISKHFLGNQMNLDIHMAQAYAGGKVI